MTLCAVFRHHILGYFHVDMWMALLFLLRWVVSLFLCICGGAGGLVGWEGALT
jgi:hypothetical protein